MKTTTKHIIHEQDVTIDHSSRRLILNASLYSVMFAVWLIWQLHK